MGSAGLVIDMAQLVFAGTLVIVTIIYAHYTKLQVREMRKNRKAEFEPSLKGDFEHFAPTSVWFKLENTGKSAVHDVTFEWEISDYSPTWGKRIISPGETHVFPAYVDEDDEWISSKNQLIEIANESNGELRYKVSCTSLLDDSYTIEETIDVEEALEKKYGYSEIVQKDELKEIRKELEEISDKLN